MCLLLGNWISILTHCLNCKILCGTPVCYRKPCFVRIMKYHLGPPPCCVFGPNPLIWVMYICYRLDECVMFIVDCLNFVPASRRCLLLSYESSVINWSWHVQDVDKVNARERPLGLSEGRPQGSELHTERVQQLVDPQAGEVVHLMYGIDN